MDNGNTSSLDLISQFLSLKSENTQLAYRRVIKDFLTFTNHKQLHDGTASDVISFINHLKVSGASDNTIRHRFHVLKSVYGFLEDMEEIQSSPTKKASRLLSLRRQRQVRPTATIEPHLIREIIQSPPPNSKRGVRDRAMLAILFGCGLRISEVQSLTIGDVVCII